VELNGYPPSGIWGPAAEGLLIVGLTGGIATGKTEVTSRLISLGAMVVDADRVARDVTLPGTEVYKRIVDEFGPEILDTNGGIDRPALAGKVFGNESRRRLLNSITHPAIFAEIIRRVQEYGERRGPGEVPAVVIDAALIVDVGASGMFDLIIVVTADEETRIRRLTGPRGMSEEDARGRVASQIADSGRLASGDIVIENKGSIDELEETVDSVWDEVARRARSRR